MSLPLTSARQIAAARRSAAPTDAATPNLTSAPFATEVQRKVDLLGTEPPFAIDAKLHLDCRATSAPVELMDEYTLELIQQLCTRVGMIMEEASDEALLTTETEPVAMREKLERLSYAAEVIVALVAAAERCTDPS